MAIQRYPASYPKQESTRINSGQIFNLIPPHPDTTGNPKEAIMKPSKYIDHTLLAPQATREQIAHLCNEAREHGFCSVCVNPYWVSFAKEALRGSGVKVCTVIGFPLGAGTSATKAFETAEAVRLGADEVDMVINIGLAKDGKWPEVEQDIAAVVQAAGKETVVKVILEICLLNEEEIRTACLCAVRAGADFVKTSTGFSDSGATKEAVALMRATVGKDFGVKASGGIRTPEDFSAMLAAGANRIGASAGVKLLGGGQADNGSSY